MLALPFYAEELGASATVLGLILSAYAAAQFLFAPIWGRLSDQIGRRSVLLVSIAGMGFSLIALGLAETLPAIFAARIAGGVFAANIGVASAYVADVTDPDERTRWMGVLGACFGVGFVLGPAIAGLVEWAGWGVALMGTRAAALPILVAGGLAGINFVWAACSLSEPEAHSKPDPGDFSSRFEVLRDPEVRRLCAAWLLFSVGVTQLEATFAFFMIERFHYDMGHVAFIFVGMAVLMGAVQGGGMRRLASKFGERRLVFVGSILCALSFATLPMAVAILPLLLILAATAVGRAVVQPSMMGLTSTAGSEASRGLVMGTFQSGGSLARVFGPALAGWLFDRDMAIPFFFAASLFVCVAGLTRRFPERAAESAGSAAGV